MAFSTTGTILTAYNLFREFNSKDLTFSFNLPFLFLIKALVKTFGN